MLSHSTLIFKSTPKPKVYQTMVVLTVGTNTGMRQTENWHHFIDQFEKVSMRGSVPCKIKDMIRKTDRTAKNNRDGWPEVGQKPQ